MGVGAAVVVVVGALVVDVATVVDVVAVVVGGGGVVVLDTGSVLPASQAAARTKMRTRGSRRTAAGYPRPHRRGGFRHTRQIRCWHEARERCAKCGDMSVVMTTTVAIDWVALSAGTLAMLLSFLAGRIWERR